MPRNHVQEENRSWHCYPLHERTYNYRTLRGPIAKSFMGLGLAVFNSCKVRSAAPLNAYL
jgi:hypothetical protein